MRYDIFALPNRNGVNNMRFDQETINKINELGGMNAGLQVLAYISRGWISKLLNDAGYNSLNDLKAADDAQLQSISGVGRSSVQAIRALIAQLEQATDTQPVEENKGPEETAASEPFKGSGLHYLIQQLEIGALDASSSTSVLAMMGIGANVILDMIRTDNINTLGKLLEIDLQALQAKYALSGKIYADLHTLRTTLSCVESAKKQAEQPEKKPADQVQYGKEPVYRYQDLIGWGLRRVSELTPSSFIGAPNKLDMTVKQYFQQNFYHHPFHWYTNYSQLSMVNACLTPFLSGPVRQGWELLALHLVGKPRNLVDPHLLDPVLLMGPHYQDDRVDYYTKTPIWEVFRDEFDRAFSVKDVPDMLRHPLAQMNVLEFFQKAFPEEVVQTDHVIHASNIFKEFFDLVIRGLLDAGYIISASTLNQLLTEHQLKSQQLGQWPGFGWDTMLTPNKAASMFDQHKQPNYVRPDMDLQNQLKPWYSRVEQRSIFRNGGSTRALIFDLRTALRDDMGNVRPITSKIINRILVEEFFAGKNLYLSDLAAISAMIASRIKNSPVPCNFVQVYLNANTADLITMSARADVDSYIQL